MKFYFLIKSIKFRLFNEFLKLKLVLSQLLKLKLVSQLMKLGMLNC